MDSGEQFGISFKGKSEKNHGTKGDFGDLSRGHGSTDPLGASNSDLSLFVLIIAQSSMKNIPHANVP